MLSHSTIQSFLCALFLPSRYTDSPRISHVRHLTVQASPLYKPTNGIEAYSRSSLYTIHQKLPDVLRNFPELTTFTLKDTLILHQADASVLFKALKLIRPKKARLEIRMWDLYDSPVGQDLIAAICPSIDSPMTRVVSTAAAVALNRATQPMRDAGRSLMQEAWRDALFRGGELEFPQWWTEPPRADPPAAGAGANLVALGGHHQALLHAMSLAGMGPGPNGPMFVPFPVMPPQQLPPPPHNHGPSTAPTQPATTAQTTMSIDIHSDDVNLPAPSSPQPTSRSSRLANRAIPQALTTTRRQLDRIANAQRSRTDHLYVPSTAPSSVRSTPSIVIIDDAITAIPTSTTVQTPTVPPPNTTGLGYMNRVRLSTWRPPQTRLSPRPQTRSPQASASRRSDEIAAGQSDVALPGMTSYHLAHHMRGELVDLLENHWTPYTQAFSFVAFDPLASLIVRAPQLDLWTRVTVPHVRVHLPRGCNSLAVFKGAKETARDRQRNRRNNDDGTEPQAANIDESEEEANRVVGGDGMGGDLVHEDIRLLEIEVNTLAEMSDDVWIRCGDQLPPQVCRILVGEQDWRDLRIGRSFRRPAFPPSNIQSPFPSPIFGHPFLSSLLPTSSHFERDDRD